MPSARRSVSCVVAGSSVDVERAGVDAPLAALTASGVAILAVLTWAATAAADPGRVEEERFGCAGDCRSVERQVRHLVDDGWTCAERREMTSTTWRCTLD